MYIIAIMLIIILTFHKMRKAKNKIEFVRFHTQEMVRLDYKTPSIYELGLIHNYCSATYDAKKT